MLQKVVLEQCFSNIKYCRGPKIIIIGSIKTVNAVKPHRKRSKQMWQQTQSHSWWCQFLWVAMTDQNNKLKKMTVCLEKGLISAVDKDLHWSTGECLPKENCFSMSLMMDFKHLKCSIHVFSSSGLLGFFFSLYLFMSCSDQGLLGWKHISKLVQKKKSLKTNKTWFKIISEPYPVSIKITPDKQTRDIT